MTIRKVGTAEIVRELGRGGMGVVYEARQPELGRTVAVKELSADATRDADALERFRREGRAYAQLRHQAVVAVHDLIEKNGATYLITEFVDGQDLSKLVKQGPLPPRAWRSSAGGWQRRWTTSTSRSCCTATSSRPTSCSPARAR